VVCLNQGVYLEEDIKNGGKPISASGSRVSRKNISKHPTWIGPDVSQAQVGCFEMFFGIPGDPMQKLVLPPFC